MRLARLILSAALVAATSPLPAGADDPAPTRTRTTLEDRLKTGLRARRPEEFEFIAEVSGLVRSGILPGKLVDSTYLWSLQRQQKYPYPLFERALRIQARRIGVEL